MRHTDTISRTLFAALIVLAPPPSSGSDWPQFRGPDGSGIAERQNLPDRWNVASGDNILWRAALPGLAHSSPIVWGERVYVTTAVADEGTDVRFGTGNSSIVGSYLVHIGSTFIIIGITSIEIKRKLPPRTIFS